MSVQIQLRRGTAAAWTGANPTLADGEYGYETDTGKRKIGDGVTAWNSLAYLSGGAGGGGVSLIAGTQTATSGTVSFADSNGVTFGLSGSTRITATVKTDYQTSGAYLTTADLSANSSNYVRNWKLTGNTAGTTSSAQGTDLWISGGQGITASGNSNTIVLSVGSYITTADLSANSSNYVRNWKLTGNTAGTTSSAQGTDLWFEGGNSITVSGNSNTIKLSVGAYLTTADLSANSSKYVQNWKLTGNTAGTTSSAQGTDLWFSGGQGITASGNSNTIVLSVGSYITTGALSGDTSKYMQNWKLTGNTAGTTSSAEGTDLWLSGGPNITLSGNSKTIVISGGAGAGGDGGVFAGVSNVGNTAGSTGTVSTGNFVLAASQGLTLSQSTGAAGSAATVTINGPRLSQYYPLYQGSMSVVQKGQGSFHVQPMTIPCELQFDLFVMPMFFSNDTNSSGSGSISWWVGIYTRNASTLSVLHSTSHSSAFTMSGTAGSYSLYAGVRRYGIPWTTTIQPGDYWIGMGSSTNTAVANMSISQYHITRLNSNVSGAFGFANNTSRGLFPGQGMYATQTAGVPTAVGYTDLAATVGNNQCPVVYYMLSNTF